MKKLLNFRQLSLNSDSPQQTPIKKRQLKKQFSEDFNYDLILNNNNNFWINPAENNESVIIKKCGENRKVLIRQDSEKMRKNLKKNEKPNLKIFLTPNCECDGKFEPKINQPLMNSSSFKIKKKSKIDNFEENIKKEILQKKPRRPLIRSLSAPCNPEYKKTKKNQIKTNNNNNNNNNVQINDIITMVSLISPAGSDYEEEENLDLKKIKNPNLEKISPPTPKIMSLKKAVKTVSFQQSSIHAIRSFSASFPARRASVSAAMMLSNSLNVSLNHSAKVQEKRSTNSIKPDDDERMPKRRHKDDNKIISNDSSENIKESTEISIQSSSSTQSIKIAKESSNTEESSNQEETLTENERKNKELIINPDLKSQNEKQCWNMYCKMMEKGINVSFDTILRGMLTPTEYRLSRKNSLVAFNNDKESDKNT